MDKNSYKNPDTDLVCKICNNNSNNELVIAQERQFGMGDQFEYFICSNCNCLQIKEIPENISKYYPSEYYSFQEAVFPTKLNFINSYLKKSLIKYYMGYSDFTGFLLSFVYDHPFPWIREREVSFKSRILDVGTGSGRKILSLQRSGFTNLTGLDPFIQEDIFYTNGVTVLKKNISEMCGQFDFIMLHHSFEHMPNPGEVAKHIDRLLAPDGCALIRIPISNSYAWEKYREFWAQLDAPRHFFIHSPKSIEILLKGTDLVLDDIIYDSTIFQFVGSEKYLRNLTLSASDTFISKKELKHFEKEAARLNKNKTGDAACFYLKKSHREVKNS